GCEKGPIGSGAAEVPAGARVLARIRECRARRPAVPRVGGSRRARPALSRPARDDLRARRPGRSRLPGPARAARAGSRSRAHRLRGPDASGPDRRAARDDPGAARGAGAGAARLLRRLRRAAPADPAGLAGARGAGRAGHRGRLRPRGERGAPADRRHVGYGLLRDGIYGPQAALAMVRAGSLPFIMGQTMVLRRRVSTRRAASAPPRDSPWTTWTSA